MTSKLYDTDFYAWAIEQSQFLQEGKWQALDITNLVEEIEALGKQQRQELRNRLGVLIGHLLKWDYQSDLRGKSWKATIREQRKEVLRLLKESPSLKSYLQEGVIDAYESSLALVVRETPLDYQDLPSECPYSNEQILDPAFPKGLL
ncbi:DUF29 domain-containing protein [Pseudanabaena sp. PCC 6802]|uniref:DUF29 domain-containing protein n=1 Tax=Pseudanabaena sp. PCC 6802 TaxID=118173 RepID=UPI00034CA6A2|nr:DUF29 domain-containing protein [Pseudanabaena sp. PCC 6802]